VGKFKTGHPKLGGRKPGTPNKNTFIWEQLGNWMVEDGATKAMKELAQLKGEKYLRFYAMFCEYFKPKLSRIENREFTRIEELLMLSDEERKETIAQLRKRLNGTS